MREHSVSVRPARCRRIAALLAVAALLLLPACSSIPVWKGDYRPGPVLVTPPRDVVQGGQPHERGAGSGKMLGDAVGRRLRSSGWTVLTTEDPRFGHAAAAEPGAALEEARRLGADYVLIMVLGEFRDAAPFSFRSDFVTLASAEMLAAATGEAVWRMTEPYQVAKGNIGGYAGLVDDLGAEVAESIAGAPAQ